MFKKNRFLCFSFFRCFWSSFWLGHVKNPFRIIQLARWEQKIQPRDQNHSKNIKKMKTQKNIFFNIANYVYFQFLKSWVQASNTEKVFSKKLFGFFDDFPSSGTTFAPKPRESMTKNPGFHGFSEICPTSRSPKICFY